MAERVTTTIGGYELEYSREPLLELFSRASQSRPETRGCYGIGGVGWSGRVHAWAVIPKGGYPGYPESWMVTATEPETGMLGTVEFDTQGNAIGISVGETEPLSYGTPLNGLLSGWTNALQNSPGGAISSEGLVRARRVGDAKWEEPYLSVGCDSVCAGDSSW